MALVVAEDDPRAEDVQPLLERHRTFAHEVTPPEDLFALDLDGLLGLALTFFTARLDGAVVGMGALKQLDASHGELKSMHTLQEARRHGVGRALVEHMVSVARDRAYRRLSLETGNTDAFEGARAFYASFGFVPCEPFGEYRSSGTSACMTMELDPASGGS